MQVPIDQARAGDILIFHDPGFLSWILSHLIVLLKEPKWDRWGWHMGPVIGPNQYIDATWPRVKFANLNEPPWPKRVYRIFDEPPSQSTIDRFVKSHVGRPYDWFVYIMTSLAVLFRPRIDIPRIITETYDCWEVTCDFCEDNGFFWNPADPSIPFDYNYPFITDFLHRVGELPLKTVRPEQKGNSFRNLSLAWQTVFGGTT